MVKKQNFKSTSTGVASTLISDGSIEWTNNRSYSSSTIIHFIQGNGHFEIFIIMTNTMDAPRLYFDN